MNILLINMYIVIRMNKKNILKIIKVREKENDLFN